NGGQQGTAWCACSSIRAGVWALSVRGGCPASCSNGGGGSISKRYCDAGRPSIQRNTESSVVLGENKDRSRESAFAQPFRAARAQCFGSSAPLHHKARSLSSSHCVANMTQLSGTSQPRCSPHINISMQQLSMLSGPWAPGGSPISLMSSDKDVGGKEGPVRGI
ncbi:hypothetical protein KUCAC02_002846, partial [Chaenocephalus aceratus]